MLFNGALTKVKLSISVLIVEDEESLASLLKLNLELEGYQTQHAADGETAITMASEGKFNVIVLDIMIPKINGLEVCRKLRAGGIGTPILFLSARASGDDRVQGLKSGGDDYMVKPFNLEEFLLRIRILADRSRLVKPEVTQDYTFGNFKVNYDTYEVFENGRKAFELTNREIRLFKLLADKQGEVVSREEILDTIWGQDAFPSSRTIDNYILAFRKYFKDNPRNPRHFHSIRGVGYKFTP